MLTDNGCHHENIETTRKEWHSQTVITLVCHKCFRTKVVMEREYPACVIVFRLKKQDKTTYIVPTEIFSLGRVMSRGPGRNDYEFTCSLASSGQDYDTCPHCGESIYFSAFDMHVGLCEDGPPSQPGPPAVEDPIQVGEWQQVEML